MCAIVCYMKGKRQVRYVKSEIAEAVCIGLVRRGFKHIDVRKVEFNYD